MITEAENVLYKRVEQVIPNSDKVEHICILEAVRRLTDAGFLIAHVDDVPPPPETGRKTFDDESMAFAELRANVYLQGALVTEGSLSGWSALPEGSWLGDKIARGGSILEPHAIRFLAEVFDEARGVNR